MCASARHWSPPLAATIGQELRGDCQPGQLVRLPLSYPMAVSCPPQPPNTQVEALFLPIPLLQMDHIRTWRCWCLVCWSCATVSGYQWRHWVSLPVTATTVSCDPPQTGPSPTSSSSQCPWTSLCLLSICLTSPLPVCCSQVSTIPPFWQLSKLNFYSKIEKNLPSHQSLHC